MKNIYLSVFVLFGFFIGCSNGGGGTPNIIAPAHVYTIQTSVTLGIGAEFSPDGYFYPLNEYYLTAKILDNESEIDDDIVWNYTHIYGGSSALNNGNWLEYPQQTKQSGTEVILFTSELYGDSYHEFKFDLTAHGVTKTLTFRVVPNE